LKYRKIRRNPAQFVSLTGLTIVEFDALVKDFEVDVKEYLSRFTFEGKPRIRVYKPRKTSVLPTTKDKLFFTLIFMKNNPLQESHAAMFEMTQPKANMLIHTLVPLLRKTLKRLEELPERRASRISYLLENQPDVLLDGIERPIQRPSDYELADEHYSGKKNS
jgi:hypothetical protein